MAIYKTVESLDDCGAYAWPGGYPISFYPVDEYGSTDGSVICFDCARRDLEDSIEFGDGQNSGVLAEVENGDQQFYGGVMCDQCNGWIVEPSCPECGDELSLKSRTLHADNVDASILCLDCAAQLAYRGYYAACDANPPRQAGAKRIPGIGIEIVAMPDYGTPWYAPAGTLYTYR